jgi:hypothetical protein
MAAVMIGVDPHKASHTAVAIGAAEEPLGELRVRTSAAQVVRLLAWAGAWPERTWAVEGAGGIGHLLAQQLLAAGERVLDVQPKLGARVRLLATGAVNKNDPNDARSVAIAALRSAGVREVRPDDHAAVLKVWSKRHRDLGRTRTQLVCRLHAVLCDLIPGGVPKAITAAHAAHLLESITPSGAVAAARCELAAAFTEDLRGIDAAMHQTRKKLTTAVQAAGTSLTEIFGVGPVIAARSSATSAKFAASPAGITSPPTTAPRRSRCHRGTARSTGCPGAGTGASTTPSTWPRSPRSATGTATAAPTSTRNWPRERPAKKRSARSNGTSATPSSPASRPTPGGPRPAPRAREGTRGTTLSPARPAHTPNTGSSAKPLPDLTPPYDPGQRPGARRPSPKNRAEPLDTKRRSLGAVASPGPGTAVAVRIW